MTARIANQLKASLTIRLLAALAFELVFACGCGDQQVSEGTPEKARGNFKVLSVGKDNEVILDGTTSQIALIDRGQSILAGPLRISGEPLRCVMSVSGASALVVAVTSEKDGLSEYRIYTLNEAGAARSVEVVSRQREFTHFSPDPFLDAVIPQGDTGKFSVIWGVMKPLEKYVGVEIVTVDSNAAANDKRVRLDGEALGMEAMLGRSSTWYLGFLRAEASEDRLLILCLLLVLEKTNDGDELVVAVTMDGDLNVVSRDRVVSTGSETRGSVRDLVKSCEIRYDSHESTFFLNEPLLLRPLDDEKKRVLPSSLRDGR